MGEEGVSGSRSSSGTPSKILVFDLVFPDLLFGEESSGESKK